VSCRAASLSGLLPNQAGEGEDTDSSRCGTAVDLGCLSKDHQGSWCVQRSSGNPTQEAPHPRSPDSQAKCLSVFAFSLPLSFLFRENPFLKKRFQLWAEAEATDDRNDTKCGATLDDWHIFGRSKQSHLC
jgi:hypothetical protein